MQSKSLCAALALTLALTAGKALAESHAEKAPAHQMSEADMAKWMAHATPGEAHKVLEPLIGKWTFQSKMWMAPGAPEDTSTGESEDTWVLDGRFIYSTHKSSMMGQPFNGIGYTGYDNTAKKYNSIWMDSFGTSVLVGYGSFDPAKKELTIISEYDDPMSGTRRKMRMVTRILSADSHEFEIHDSGADGKEFKIMAAVYTRKP